MKGLFLTDIYMAMKYCRSYLLIMLVFIAVSFFGNDNTFLIIYPIVLAGTMPVTLMSYSERCKWNVYCETLPLTRRQVVTEKYLLTGTLLLGVFLLVAAVQGVRLSAGGHFDAEEYCAFLSPLFAVGLLSPSITLPCMFKFGVEKGRIAYYVVVGMVCGVAAAGVFLSDTPKLQTVLPSHTALLLPLFGMAAFAVSYWISASVYAKRELD